MHPGPCDPGPCDPGRLTAEQREFVRAVDEFCERECPAHRLRELTGNGTVAHHPGLYRKLAATGWVGLGIPEEYGGCGGGLAEVGLLVERLGYHRLPLDGHFATVITTQALIRYASDEQKRRVLPAVADGAVLSIAISEADVGSDAASLRTRARRAGDGWLINGEKVYTSGARHARWVLLATRTDDEVPRHRGLSLFLLPMDAVEVTPLEMLGQVDTTITRYHDVPAGDEDIVGGLGQGWTVLVRGLNSERMIVGAKAVGLAQRAFDDTLAYVKARHQFGQPIGRFQAIQHGLAETATKLLAARLMVRHTAALLDAGDPAAAEASMTKLFASELAQQASQQGMQFMGGLGYSMEHDMQAYVRDALVMTIFGGTSQIQKNIIAAQLGLSG